MTLFSRAAESFLKVAIGTLVIFIGDVFDKNIINLKIKLKISNIRRFEYAL